MHHQMRDVPLLMVEGGAGGGGFDLHHRHINSSPPPAESKRHRLGSSYSTEPSFISENMESPTFSAVPQRPSSVPLKYVNRLFRSIGENLTIESKILLLRHGINIEGYKNIKYSSNDATPISARIWSQLVQDSWFSAEMGLRILALITSPSTSISHSHSSSNYIQVFAEYCASYRQIDIFRMLLTSPTHKHLITPKILNDSLIQASMCNLPQLVRLLLQHGADPHYDNGAALSMSAKYGWSEVVEILLAHGADVDVDEGYPLMWACRNGHVEVVRLLFEQGGADAGSRDGTPLNVAAEYGHVPIVSYLLSSSHAAQQTAVNVHAQEDYPLRWASVRGHEPVVRLLLSKYGANVGAMNNFALRNSVKLRHYDVVRTLMEFGADPLAMDSEAIRVAVAGADDVLLQLLIRRPTNSSIPGSMENLSESLADSLTVAEE